MQAVEKEIDIIKNRNKRRPHVREISRYSNLCPMSRKMYKMILKLKRRDRYLKGITKKQTLKATLSSIANTENTTVLQNLINMIQRNTNVPSQVSQNINS